MSNRTPNGHAAAAAITRRWFLRQCPMSLGSVALGAMLAEGQARAGGSIGGLAATDPLAPKLPPLPAKAKRVIYLFMAGAPSHLDLFDYKPELAKHDGKLPPAELLKGYRAAFINPNSNLLGPKYAFKRYGNCGAQMATILPHIGKVADELCVIKSMKTEAINHAPAQIMMNTGSQQFGRPSMGAWVLYGLGSESRDLPGFVVLQSGTKGPSGGAANWGSGFLPSVHEAVPFRGGEEPVLYLSNPRSIDREMQRDMLDTVRTLNEERQKEVGDPEIATRINAYEMAFRMQSSVPGLVDLSGESAKTLALYGAEPGKRSFANNCLLARRLIERGVRFVQLFHEAWDHHGGLTTGLFTQCKETDQATGALITDLKARGLLDDTIVIWGGEFGRTPMVQGTTDGRDHHPNAFTMLLAGGGFKPGITFGKSDDFGFNATENIVHVHDLHATILHQLGFDHTRLTYRFQGRDFRLTDVHGNIVREILA